MRGNVFPHQTPREARASPARRTTGTGIRVARTDEHACVREMLGRGRCTLRPPLAASLRTRLWDEDDRTADGTVGRPRETKNRCGPIALVCVSLNATSMPREPECGDDCGVVAELLAVGAVAPVVAVADRFGLKAP